MAGKPEVKMTFMRVGSLRPEGVLDRVMDNANPMGVRLVDKSDGIRSVVQARVRNGSAEFSRLRRNCQMHATRVIRGLNPDP
jgi:hypothetical protein